MSRWLRTIAVMGVLSGTAEAGEPAKVEAPGPYPPLADFARANPTCVSFTDDCQTCVRALPQSIQCSMPGIACIRQVWRCTEHAPEKP
jgi:hypothetical protein